ncbi:MAG: PocR ligand-binding domain-containing protein [Lachnospiraceae bacterium]
MESFKLTDLIDIDRLQKIQDSLSKITGMAIQISDQNGIPLTKGSGFTNFCSKFTRSSEIGCERCRQCDKLGAEAAFKTGEITSYMRHAGLMECAAPIVVQNQMVGCLVGGQFLIKRPPKALIRGIAKDLNLDFDAYWAALEQIPLANPEQTNLAIDFLTETGNVISDIINGKYMAIEAGREAERVASLKSDFLANMSHEIRTPMNAVIGMAEMALREDLSPDAKNYITQIKTSGKALLNIINDILDFSKIDSGKMDINPEEYEPASMLNDVASIAMTRLRDKDVELLISINPTFPKALYGDDLRIRQILINLVNNAIKFTNKGHVDILVDYEPMDADNILVKVSVKDTGIGIKENDLGKLFQSFQQVDSKRNRNIEGTGLGLAISQKLLALMGGDIHVSSVYEQGSTFSFKLPQKVLNHQPVIQISNVDELVAIGYFSNKYFAKQFFFDTNRMDVYSIALIAPDCFEELLNTYKHEISEKSIYLFLEECLYNEETELILRKHPEITGVLLTEFFSQTQTELPNLKIMKKPFSTLQLAMVLNDEELVVHDSDEMFEFDFVAPDANILIVDDNPVNLVVAEGLLQPLDMRIISATSGKMALDLIGKQHFDLIFMDHMMPELDGVETTRIIRRLHPTYDDVPIIALTANAMDGSREMFLSEGMNDFVPKPIELKNIVTKIKKWLPHQKISKRDSSSLHSTIDAEVHTIDRMEIGDLDTDTVRKMLGSDQLFFRILKEYYKAIPKKSLLIKEYEEQQNWKAYTIEVHALKSVSRQIGANSLADMAAELERAGNVLDIPKIKKQTNQMLQKYVGYLDILKPLCEEKTSSTSKDTIALDDLQKLFDEMKNALDNLDMDQMEHVIEEMSLYDYPDAQKTYFEQLKSAVENIDVDSCEEVIKNWKSIT